jgi:Flp pilus assembly protein TadG
VALIFGLMIPVIILATGVAVDTGRWIQAKRVTANAMDAAVLAGARRLQLFPDDDTGAIAVA